MSQKIKTTLNLKRLSEMWPTRLLFLLLHSRCVFTCVCHIALVGSALGRYPQNVWSIDCLSALVHGYWLKWSLDEKTLVDEYVSPNPWPVWKSVSKLRYQQIDKTYWSNYDRSNERSRRHCIWKGDRECGLPFTTLKVCIISLILFPSDLEKTQKVGYPFVSLNGRSLILFFFVMCESNFVRLWDNNSITSLKNRRTPLVWYQEI